MTAPPGPSPLGKFSAQMIDPPWDPQTWSDKGKGRHPSAHYDTMSFDEIAALPVRDYAAKDCSVFLWIPDQFLVRGVQVDLFKAWGCVSSSVAFYWVKTARRFDKQPPLFLVGDNKDFPMGQGLTTRKGVEACVLACYGKLGRQDRGMPQVIFAPRRANSQKPDEAYVLIERLVKGPYLEWFARQRHAGWEQVYSPEADSGPGRRRWAANSYPGAPNAIGNNDDAVAAALAIASTVNHVAEKL
jgi:N6-adenosine-specific RNA methylase IME4